MEDEDAAGVHLRFLPTFVIVRTDGRTGTNALPHGVAVVRYHHPTGQWVGVRTKGGCVNDANKSTFFLILRSIDLYILKDWAMAYDGHSVKGVCRSCCDYTIGYSEK